MDFETNYREYKHVNVNHILLYVYETRDSQNSGTLGVLREIRRRANINNKKKQTKNYVRRRDNPGSRSCTQGRELNVFRNEKYYCTYRGEKMIIIIKKIKSFCGNLFSDIC